MKTIIRIQPISDFIYKSDFKTRTEIEFYSDGTNSIAEAVYYYK
ncbi:hypothetical protein SAMN05880573_104121 [Chryseobacterium sp. RU33C]|nr:hypothetical protein SAMN05880573_104121 [Chryseobacterium sp. RU33C]